MHSALKALLTLATACFLLTSAGFVVAAQGTPPPAQQIDSTELVNRSQGQQLVSKNQLLIPGKAWKSINQARENLMRGDLASAQKEVARALEIAPHCGVALTLQGALNLRMGHLDTAADSFQEAIDKDPTLAAAYLGLARILISEHRFKEALTLLDRATGLLPTSWHVHFQTGLAQLGLGNIEAARKEAASAEGLTGTDPARRSGVYYLHAMVSLEMKDIAGTRKYLADTITCDPHGYYAEQAKGWLERLHVDLMSNR
jgi:tetratricopeptide (TPR) repeat protein